MPKKSRKLHLAPPVPHSTIRPTTVGHGILLPLLRAARIRLPLDGLQPVSVSPMTAQLRGTAERRAILKQGFYNAAAIASEHVCDGCRYVVGYACADGLAHPFEHAWVEIGGIHYDPTWEIFSTIGDEYLPVYLLSVEELTDVMNRLNTNLPPSLWDLHRLTGKRTRPLR